MRLSIRYQLLLPLLTLMVGVAGMSTWTALASANRARHQLEKQMLEVGGTVSSATFPRNLAALRLMKGMAGADFLLCDSHRQPLLDEEGQPLMTLAELPTRIPEPAKDWRANPLGQAVEVAGHGYFCQSVPVGADVQANLIVYIFYSQSLWRDALWQAIRPALIFGVLGSLISILLLVVVAARLTRRIQQMDQRTRQIAAGDFSPMDLPSRDDELRDLGQSVNDMAQQLAQYQETMARTERLRLLGQVSGGLAHQLRNGVTGARLAIQLFHREYPDSKSSESLQVALRQLGLVETHLKRFLDLGKALQLDKKPCDLNHLVQEALTLITPQCRHAHIDLRPPINTGPLQLNADASQLNHVLLNLLTNAAEAASPGGWVQVRLENRGQRAYLDVLDSGPGPDPALAPRLFEPFVTGKPEGVGLGLAVARQVAEAHGGALSWSRQPEGTCFRLELPLHAVKLAPARACNVLESSMASQ